MSMVTAAECLSNSMKETMTPMACLECACSKDPKAVDGVDAAGWKLIECIGERCGGDGSDIACITAMAPMGCGDVATAGATTARPTGMAFAMCAMQCRGADMDDAGTQDAGK